MSANSAPTTTDLLPGMALEEAGDYSGAARAYQAVLVRNPDDPTALQRLGHAMGRLGHRDLELELVGQAIARSPDTPAYHQHLGEALLDAGYPADAAEAFRAVLKLDPKSQAGSGGLADALIDLGLADEARRLVGPAPYGAVAARLHRALGRLELVEGREAAAVEHFMAHLRSEPRDVACLFYLGVALQGLDLLEAAAASYAQAVAIDPTLFEAFSNLGTALLALGRPTDALVAAGRALELAPNRPGAWLNRANARRDADDLTGAGDDYRRAVALDPSYAEAWSSLGNLYHDFADWTLALDAHARAVTLAPDVPQVRWNRSFTLLATGDLTAGFADYEFRLGTAAARPEPRDFPWPVWSGQPIAGKRLLVWREQGLGDELLFAAAIPLLVATGAKLTLIASPRLESLFQRAFPSADIVADGNPPALSAAEFDYQLPLASLPHALRMGRADFDRLGRFLVADPAQVAKWTTRLAALPAGPKVGICWRSGLVTPDRIRHYAPLQAWKPIIKRDGYVLVNLQYDECTAEIDAIARDWGVTVHRWPEENLKDDLESVIGLMAALDAVVSAPTAVTSLAGAIGSPTIQVDSGSDWTVFGEPRSPWFPTLRVVGKRASDADWGPVMGAALAELEGVLTPAI